MRHTMRDARPEMKLAARQEADFLQVRVSTTLWWSNNGILKRYRVGSRDERSYPREGALRSTQGPSRHLQSDIAQEKVLLPHGIGERLTQVEEQRHGRQSWLTRNRPRLAAVRSLKKKHWK